MITTDQASEPSTSNQELTDFGVPSSAYLHIPFCRRRCYYCDFPVAIVGDRLRGETSGTINHYVEILCQEIINTPSAGIPLKTVFFGGGTPSLLSVEQLTSIINSLERHFGITSDAEISIEIDPGTFDLFLLQGYRKAGVNRISLGTQAFQAKLLQAAGRSHSLNDILAAVDLVRQVEVPEFSLDLISGLPHQTLEDWQESLETVVAIAPTHISTYDLIIESGTAFGRYYQPGSQPLPTDETTAQMYRLGKQILNSAGYQHYEISNYAKPGHQCRHNRVYWENRPYYGFGMGAASYIQNQRFTRPRKTREYYEWVANGCVIDSAPQLTSDILLETLMLGLRLAEGLNLGTLYQKFGEQTLDKIWHCLRYQQQGWIEIVGIDGAIIDMGNDQKLPTMGYIRLSDPEGFLYSNTILANLFNELD